MPHKGASTQHYNQQVLAKPRHQPSDRDQQAREKLRQKAKIKSCAYIQLGEEALQIVHKTFAPDIPVILHLLALVDNTIDTNTPPTLYVIQEGINCMPTMDYFFTSIKPAPIVVTRPTAHHNKPTEQQAATQDFYCIQMIHDKIKRLSNKLSINRKIYYFCFSLITCKNTVRKIG